MLPMLMPPPHAFIYHRLITSRLPVIIFARRQPPADAARRSLTPSPHLHCRCHFAVAADADGAIDIFFLSLRFYFRLPSHHSPRLRPATDCIGIETLEFAHQIFEISFIERLFSLITFNNDAFE